MPVSAETVRRRLQTVAAAGLDHDTFAMAALEILRGAVPFESACLASCDPDTELLTGSTKLELPDSRDAEFAKFEYETTDLNTFDEIARRRDGVGVLALDTEGHPERSARYRDFLVPHFDQGNELRAALRSEAATWGLLGLYRPTRAAGFSAAEAGFVCAVAPVLAGGLRAGLVCAAAAATQDPMGPAVLIVDDSDAVVGMSGAAEARVAQLGADLREGLPIQLVAVVGAARAHAQGRRATPPSARVRTRSGQWLVVHAARMASAGGRQNHVVVTLEQARPPEVVPLVVAAFGLSHREQEVVHLVLTGASTQEIGRRLHLSPYTVQDHLKSVFGKCDVSSRRELVAKVFFSHYAPAIGEPIAPSGRLALEPQPGSAGS